jgi:eukaryotic-like serine/threonine-protein kinase
MLTGRTPFEGSGPYDRLLLHPVPPREIDPAISPQLQEVIYRALEREPKNRYANAYDFASDLSNPDRVGISKRPELSNWKKSPVPRWKQTAFFLAIAMVPLVIFALLLYFAQH